MATYDGIKKIKIGDNIFKLGIPIIKINNTDYKNYDIIDVTFANTFSLTETAQSSTNTDGTSETTGEVGIALKLGYTTSGNNRAVQADSNGNLYVTQKDDNTDTKVTVAAATTGTQYYPILATGTGTATRQIDSTFAGFRYKSNGGTTSGVGNALLELGNSIASGTNNNERGIIRLYGSKAYYTDIRSSVTSANKTVYFPDAEGTLALATDIPTGNATPTASTFSKFDSSAKMNSTDMTSSQVSTFVNSLDVSGVLSVDYVIEQGTSGIWTYRKWNSGIAECWGSVYAQKDCTSAWGTLYDSGTATSQSFPSGLFTSAPTLTLTAAGHSTATLQLETSGAVLAERTCNYYYTMPYSATGVQATVYFQAIGRWK